MRHDGFALIDVISPCVTFNDHEGSTRSYAFAREHYEEAVHADFVPPAAEIAVSYAEGESQTVTLHDGSRIVLRKVDADFDSSDPGIALDAIQQRMRRGEYLTGLLHIAHDAEDIHALGATPDAPLNAIPYESLNPGAEALHRVLAAFR